MTVSVKWLRKILLRKSLTVHVSEMVGVLDDLIKYSYRFHVKLLDIPQTDPTSREPTVQMAKLFICLFNSIGADVICNNMDIDIEYPSECFFEWSKTYHLQICDGNSSERIHGASLTNHRSRPDSH